MVARRCFEILRIAATQSIDGFNLYFISACLFQTRGKIKGGKIKGVRNRLLTFGNRFDIFHGSWDDQTERQMVG